jgi:excisionase family DNA binding protein
MEKIILTTETELKNLIKEILIELKPKEQTPFISRSQTCKLLGLSLPTLGKYTKDGKIQSYKIGSQIRYKRDEVLTCLENIKSQKKKSKK